MSVLPLATLMVLDAPNVMPRLILSVISAVASRVPPFKVIEFAVVEPGTAPKLASLLIDSVPALIDVVPV